MRHPNDRKTQIFQRTAEVSLSSCASFSANRRRRSRGSVTKSEVVCVSRNMSWGGKSVEAMAMATAAVACAATAVVVYRRIIQRWQRGSVHSVLHEFRNACATPLPLLRQVADAMAMEMHAGLVSDGGSRLKMLPTFVESLPTGEERGLYYAVDLGGTNFRVLRIQLGGKEGRILKQEYEEVAIPQDLMVGSSKGLFDFIAKSILHFVTKEGDGFKCLALNQQRDIGFTFSFPVHQTSINEGEIIQWTKGFNIDDAVGQDVVGHLQTALGKKGSQMKVICLVNDTVGTLAQCRYWNEDAMVGVILGTGTNACYVERADAISKRTGSSPKSGMTVINTEWGNFFSSALPRTFADEELDKDSLNPGQQQFEKMMSGMYMGEIVRRVLLKMAQSTDLFGATIPEKLTERFALTTPDMSAMHGDESGDLRVVAKVMRDAMGVTYSTQATRKIVYNVCDVVAQRGARLAAAGIVGILKKSGRDGSTVKLATKRQAIPVNITTHSTDPSDIQAADRTVVAIDGGLYEHYGKFRAYMEDAMAELLGKENTAHVTTKLSKDGSGIGAALLAAALSTHRARQAR